VSAPSRFFVCHGFLLSASPPAACVQTEKSRCRDPSSADVYSIEVRKDRLEKDKYLLTSPKFTRSRRRTWNCSAGFAYYDVDRAFVFESVLQRLSRPEEVTIATSKDRPAPHAAPRRAALHLRRQGIRRAGLSRPRTQATATTGSSPSPTPPAAARRTAEDAISTSTTSHRTRSFSISTMRTVPIALTTNATTARSLRRKTRCPSPSARANAAIPLRKTNDFIHPRRLPKR
jgi:hypothetical protein